MLEGLADLERMGGGSGIKSVLERRPGLSLPFEHPLSGIVRRTTDATLMLDRALGAVSEKLKGCDDWLQRKMDQVWSTDATVSSSALSELEALGTLLDVFPYRPRESLSNE